MGQAHRNGIEIFRPWDAPADMHEIVVAVDVGDAMVPVVQAKIRSVTLCSVIFTAAELCNDSNRYDCRGGGGADLSHPPW